MTQRTLHGRKTVQGFPRPLTVVVGTEPDGPMTYHDLGPGPAFEDTVIAAMLPKRRPWYTRFIAFVISLLSKSN